MKKEYERKKMGKMVRALAVWMWMRMQSLSISDPATGFTVYFKRRHRYFPASRKLGKKIRGKKYSNQSQSLERYFPLSLSLSPKRRSRRQRATGNPGMSSGSPIQLTDPQEHAMDVNGSTSPLLLLIRSLFLVPRKKSYATAMTIGSGIWEICDASAGPFTREASGVFLNQKSQSEDAGSGGEDDSSSRERRKQFPCPHPPPLSPLFDPCLCRRPRRPLRLLLLFRRRRGSLVFFVFL